MTDGRSVMLGARGKGLGASRRPLFSTLDRPGVCVIDAPAPGEERRKVGRGIERGLWEMDAQGQLTVLSSNNGLVKDGRHSI